MALNSKRTALVGKSFLEYSSQNRYFVKTKMSEESISTSQPDHSSEDSSSDGRQKQKIRIKYRQRVKIKKRPKGYKIKRYWRKNRKNLIAYVVLAVLLGATLFMVVQVAKQQLEHRQHEKNQRLRLK